MRTIAHRVWRLETMISGLPRNRRISDQETLSWKLEQLHQTAFSRTSPEDLQLLAELREICDSKSERLLSPRFRDAIDRWDQTYMEALQRSPFNFTIQEIDLVVANADCERLIHVKPVRP